jgi:glycosyltransferase involved in cell wall biosynthesis
MSVLRVALCSDFPEERWPSMDRVAAELMNGARSARSAAAAAGDVDLVRVCPPFVRRASRLWSNGSRYAFAADRALNRWWDYPRHASSFASDYDVFHVIDHSYAQLVHHLPAERTLVTCHDLDTFRSILRPEDERRSGPFRLATRRILTGLQQAAHVTCDTAAIREELLAFGLLPPERVTVVPVGVGDDFSPKADDFADSEAARLVGAPGGGVELLHVGSTIPRKRIDTLLEVCAALLPRIPDLRLVRVGEPFTADQRHLASRLGIGDRIAAVGVVDDRTLAALYRRASLLLQTSEREGFGLPVIEAMTCGTPVVASDLPALREVGAAAVEYCPVGDVTAWTHVAAALLDERRHDPVRWHGRREAGRVRARAFSWTHFASAIIDIYFELGAGGAKSRARAS